MTVESYWDSFYQSEKSHLIEYPSQFARYVRSQLEPAGTVVDIGCGNGRDSLFFAAEGFHVIAIDYSEPGLRHLHELARSLGVDERVTTVHADIGDLQGRLPLPRESSSNGPVVEAPIGLHDPLSVYCRFVVHAVDDHRLESLLAWAWSVTLPGELAFFEFRTAAQVEPHYYFGEHYRRLIPVDEFARLARRAGFRVKEFHESDDFAVFEDERPLIGRVTLVRATTDDR